MPHSSGGGSHGGGSHGSHGGSSGSGGVSHHYYPGARRYRRHYRNGSRPDDYVYSRSLPRATGIINIVMTVVFGSMFTTIFGFSLASSAPKKLDVDYPEPEYRVFDFANLIDDDADLEDALAEYNDTTGICPVIYTVTDEEWEDDYVDLEACSYSYYVDRFNDEKHFVIVFSVPQDQIEAYKSGELEVADFSWEATQGDETDYIITEKEFSEFADNVMDKLEGGDRPEDAFTYAFEKFTDSADKLLNPSAVQKMSRFTPLLFVSLFFIIPIVMMIASVIKNKNIEYEEVPLSDEDEKRASAPSPYGQSNPYNPYGKGAGNPDMSSVPSAIKVFMTMFMSIFLIVGLSILFSGISELVKGSFTGIFMVMFGSFWTLIMLIIFVTSVKSFRGKKKDYGAPLTADYPKAEYPDAKPLTSDPVTSEPVTADYPEPDKYEETQKTSFLDVFSGTNHTDYDDEDYKRMKRKGYE